MFKNMKIFIWMVAGAFGIFIIMSVAGEWLGVNENNPPANTDSVYKYPVIILALFLYFVLVAVVIPLFLRMFTNLQTSIGNGDHAMIKFIRSHERVITFVAWAIILMVSLATMPLILKDLLE